VFNITGKGLMEHLLKLTAGLQKQFFQIPPDHA
jgi:hypothetical protein